MKIAVITQIRNEAKRLKEWVLFHKSYYDIDHFLFYLDYPEDNSEEVLIELRKSYNIEYKYTVPVGEYQGNNCMVATYRQRDSFKDGFNSLKKDYDWIAIYDVDEWIAPVDINNYNLKDMLSSTKENLVYLPMYNFTPPFDYDKSITEQNMYRWTTEERFRNGHGNCGKSIIRGKIFLDKEVEVNVHTGPEGVPEYHENVDFESKNHKFRLYQWQWHGGHKGKNYERYDSTIKEMFEKL